MPRISQPVTQVRLTNVAIVRFNEKGARFELACYPNKVRDWREGLEKDISEVLQSDRIFVHVHKGQFAKDADLFETFGTSDYTQCVKIILDKGTIQFSEKERQRLQQAFLRDVCQLAASRLLSASTRLPLTPQMVEKSLKQIRYAPKYFQGVPPKAVLPKVLGQLAIAFPNEIIRPLMRATVTTPVSRVCELVERTHHMHIPSSADLHIYVWKWPSLFMYKPEIQASGLTLIQSHLQEIQAVFVQSETDGSGVSTMTILAWPGDWNALHQLVCKVPDASLTVLSMADTSSPIEYQVVRETPLVQEEKEGSASEISSDSDEEEFVFSDESDDDTQKPKNSGFGLLLSGEESETEKEQATEGQRQMGDQTKHAEQEKESGEQAPSRSAAFLDTSHKDIFMKEKAREKRDRERQRKRTEKERQDKKDKAEAFKAVPDPEPSLEATGSGAFWCETCKVDVESQNMTIRQHFKTDWHTFNQKRKLKNLQAVSKADYQDLANDIREGFLAVDY